MMYITLSYYDVVVVTSVRFFLVSPVSLMYASIQWGATPHINASVRRNRQNEVSGTDPYGQMLHFHLCN